MLTTLSLSRDYIGVLAGVFGQAILFASAAMTIYGLCLGGLFHLVAVLVEKSRLRTREG